MGWFIATSNLPDKPFAVIDGDGSVAGCHASREAASLQMSTLNLVGQGDPEPTVQAAAPAEDAPVRREPPPTVAYSTSTTLAW